MLFFDTHAHLNFKEFAEDRTSVIKENLRQKVWFVNVGTNYATSKMAVKVAEDSEKGVYASMALHPIHVQKEKFDYEKFKSLAINSSKKIVAVGETGFDAMYPSHEQKVAFIEHWRLASELNLPLIIHCRKAHKELLATLKELQYRFSNGKPIQAVIHCFAGKWNEAKQYLEMGFYLGFNGIIFKMDLKEIIQKTPLEKILVETDCPFLIPPSDYRKEHFLQIKASPFKEGRNEPVLVKYIISYLSEIKKESFFKVVDNTTQNAFKFFGLK